MPKARKKRDPNIPRMILIRCSDDIHTRYRTMLVSEGASMQQDIMSYIMSRLRREQAKLQAKLSKEVAPLIDQRVDLALQKEKKNFANEVLAPTPSDEMDPTQENS